MHLHRRATGERASSAGGAGIFHANLAGHRRKRKVSRRVCLRVEFARTVQISAVFFFFPFPVDEIPFTEGGERSERVVL